MLTIEYQGQFKKDYKLAIKRGLDPRRLMEVVELLAHEQPLPPAYRDHPLRDTREYKGVRECHIQPDWLLVYRVCQDRLTLTLIRTGSHSDLFG